MRCIDFGKSRPGPAGIGVHSVYIYISFGPFKHRHAINKDFHYTEKQFEIEPLDWIHCHDLPLHDLTYTHTAM